MIVMSCSGCNINLMGTIIFATLNTVGNVSLNVNITYLCNLLLKCIVVFYCYVYFYTDLCVLKVITA